MFRDRPYSLPIAPSAELSFPQGEGATTIKPSPDLVRAQISKERHMTKLNEIAPREGSTKGRMRIGRGPGSGKGKTGGRGVKGQKARSGVAIAGFEGGQMPLHMRMPKRGFNNPFALKFAEVNLWRLEQAVAAGKLTAGQSVDADLLVATGIVRRAKDGLKLLGKGEISTALNITVFAATPGAIAAVEKAGGSVTVTRPAKVEAEA
jgi:large subunit ribosomal protein L15